MHSASELAGPVYVFVIVLMYGTGLLSLYVLIDSLRSRRTAAFATRPWTRWLWTVPQGLYFALFVSVNLLAIANAFLATALVVATIPALVQQIVYLLVVAYPAPGRFTAVK